MFVELGGVLDHHDSIEEYPGEDDEDDFDADLELEPPPEGEDRE